MKVAICEDIMEEASLLKSKIENYMPKSCFLTGIDLYATGTELLDAKTYYDLIFIDCRLPDMTGIELAQKLRERNNCSSIIFVTAFIEYATDGYKVNALRYLIKPVENDKLAEALVAYENHTKDDCTIELTGQHVPFFAKSSEIMYIESLGKRTVVRLKDQSVESAISLDTFLKDIQSSSFFRTSRQFIVNMKYISRKEKERLIMDNGEVVTVSRRKLAEFNKQYLNYLKFGN